MVSFVGGVPSMVNDGETALCFPPGDEAVLAECLRKLFDDDGLAQRLSESARKIALNRHDRVRGAERTVEIYKKVIHNWTH